MRHLALLALVAAVAAAIEFPQLYQEPITESIFRPGVEYIYRYESEALTGIRTVSDQLSGIKVRATVKVQIHRDGATLIKMENVNVYKINNGVSREPRSDMVPEHQLERLTGEQAEVMVDKLVKPIKFRLVEGEVREVQSDPTDEYWSINIKKGLISLFQLKINGRSTITDTESYLPVSIRPRTRFHDLMNPLRARRSRLGISRPMDNIFKVMELDVNGECETKYVIHSKPSLDLSSVSNMVVTKVKNFDKCITRNSFEQGVFAGLPHRESDRKLIQPAMEAEFVLSGDRHHFLIHKAKLEAKYIFTPYGQEAGQISSHIIQKLQLLTATSIRTPIPYGSFVTEKLGLKMEFPKVEFTEENSIRSRSEPVVSEWEHKQLIEKKLSDVLSSIYPVMQEISAAHLMQLSLIVRDVPRPVLLSIVKTYLQSSDHLSQKKSEILMDIIPTIETPEVAKVLIDLIRDQTIRGIRARLSIAATSLTVIPTPEVVQSLLSLYKEAEALEQQTPLLRQTVLLSVGTICNKMLNTMRRHNKPIPQLMTVVEEISSELISLLEQSPSETEKILVLKSMGNFGAKELIVAIKRVIEDKSEPVVVRTQAVFALRKIAEQFNKLVHPTLITVVLDKQESEQVRAAAFMVLKKSQPSFTTLQLIAHSLRSEPSRQIKTLIYSSLVNLATLKSHIPELLSTSRDARKVLKLMPAIPVSIIDSKECSAHLYSDSLELGGKLDVWSLKSKLTGLPKSIEASLRTTIFGNSIPLVSGGIESRGLETIIRRLVGPYGLLKDIVNSRATLYDLLKPLSGQHLGLMAEKIREFIGRRTFEPRMEEEIKGILFGEILGQEIFYNQFDPELIERLMELAVRTGPQLINQLKQGINLDALKTLSVVTNSLILPTPMGVPLSLNVSAAAIVKLEGFVKANSLPEISDFLRRRPFMSRKVEIMGHVKPSVNVEVYGYMGVDMRWIRSTTGVKATLKAIRPIKGEIIVDPMDSKVVVKMEPPTETVELIEAKVEPINLIVFVPKSLHRQPFDYELKTIYSRQNVRTAVLEKDIELPLIDSVMKVKAQWTQCMTSWCAYLPLSGKQHISVVFSPLDMSPPSTKELIFQIKKCSQDMYEEQGVDNIFLPTSRSSLYRNYRLESHELEEFAPVELENIISTPRKVELLMELGVRGFRCEKRVQAKVTWVAESNYLEHQLNVQVVGIENEEISKFKVMLNGMVRLPVMIESLSHYIRSGDVIGKLELLWGRNSFRENIVKAKVWEMSNSEWSSELMREGVEHSLPNDYLLSVTPRIFTYGAELELPQLPINYVAQTYLTKVLDVIKMQLYNHLKVSIPESIPQNKIVILGQYVSKLEKLSVIIKTPRETDFLLDLPLSCRWMQYSWPNLHDVSALSYYSNYTSLDMEQLELPEFDSYNTFHTKYTSSLTGVCKVQSDKMLTFDGVPLILPAYTSDTPSSRCNVLLAQDCSQPGLFSVSGSFKFGRWSVKMVVPSYDLELVPQSSSFDSVLLKVNGRPMRVSSSMPVELPSVISSSTRPPVVIEKISGEGVKVKVIELGLTVVLSPSNKIFIQMSPVSILQGKLCGLCGNNNLDNSDDMMTLDSQLMSSSRLFVMDNLLPSSQCDANDYQTQLALRHEGFCKKEKTLKIERTIDGLDEVCFSRSPITVCRRHCLPETTATRSVNLVCLPRLQPVARRLVALYHSGKTLLTDELSSFELSTTKSITLPINIADKCISNL